MDTHDILLLAVMVIMGSIAAAFGNNKSQAELFIESGKDAAK